VRKLLDAVFLKKDDRVQVEGFASTSDSGLCAPKLNGRRSDAILLGLTRSNFQWDSTQDSKKLRLYSTVDYRTTSSMRLVVCIGTLGSRGSSRGTKGESSIVYS
jgi:hypothetical protein